MLGACDMRPLLGTIAVPTTVLVGEEDYATPPAMAELMANAIDGAELHVLPKLRHLTPLEKPGLIAERLRAVFERAARG
jgi:3-oxoadipate enol-lactonase